MELHKLPLSITSGFIPARTASIAHARPVGPAPMQIKSYLAMGIQFAVPVFVLQIAVSLLRHAFGQNLIQTLLEFLASLLLYFLASTSFYAAVESASDPSAPSSCAKISRSVTISSFRETWLLLN